MSLQPKFTAIEILRDKWWVSVVALVVALIATPIMRYIAYRTKIVDKPDALLKPHGRPIAYLGGVAICLGLLVGLGGFAVSLGDFGDDFSKIPSLLAKCDFYALLHNPAWTLCFVAAAFLLITVIGLLDDVYSLSPRQKIFGQVAAALLLLAGGVGQGMAKMFFAHLGFMPPEWVLILVRSIVFITIVIATCNATNLLDGLDGLCGGVTAIITLGFLALAVGLAMYSRFPENDELRVGLCLAMVGAVLGFLPYNIPPASIFMGDAGSMLLGLFVATMMGLFCHEGNARWFMAAWIVYLLPTVDTGLAVVRRALSGKSIFEGDRSHLYDQLIDRGLSVRKVVGLFYLGAIIAAGLGATLGFSLQLRYSLLLYVSLLVVLAVVFLKMGMVIPPPRQPAPPPDSKKE